LARKIREKVVIEREKRDQTGEVHREREADGNAAKQWSGMEEKEEQNGRNGW
jgi:hypothetical protein